MGPKPENTRSALSPMSPPDAYQPPGSDNIAFADLHPFLQEFAAEHEAVKAQLLKFEETIMGLKEKGVTVQINRSLKEFFRFFNDEFIPHIKKEEKTIFPALNKKLIEKNKLNPSLLSITPVDMMEDDHLKAIQLTVVVFNFFGLASRLKDEASRDIVMDAALEQAYQLIELLRLHIFREDRIIFPLAHKVVQKRTVC